MKLLVIAFSFLIAASAHAESSLKNCTAAKSFEFFASEMEEIAQEGKTPVLLFNDSEQIVGVISVSPKRAEKHPFTATEIVVEKVSLCGNFEVTDFYYTDGPSANLAEWTASGTGPVAVTQDEGQIIINAKIVKKDTYGTRIDVDFKAYDVMTEEGDYTPEQKKSPEFLEDWGLPKGVGTFHFYVPASWKLAK